MPSLNVVDYINECILSAINQTLDEYEILCIDAGSIDGTCDILQKYSNQYPDKVKIINSDVKSYGYQVNLGIKKALGEYIAILESDDYVESFMYKLLVDVAQKTECDMVRADYKSFYTLENGKRVFFENELFGNDIDKYEHIIDVKDNEYIYKNDYSIWKGIYRRKFLLENDIWLNESKGAAYQDIGFMVKTLSSCERCYYINKKCYCYRMDRPTSSSNIGKGIDYCYAEFKSLLVDEYNSNQYFLKGLYLRMAYAFAGELHKLISEGNYDILDDEKIKKLEFLQRSIKKAIDKKIIDVGSISDNEYKAVFKYDEFISEELAQYSNYKNRFEKFIRLANSREVIVFGSGKIGIYIVGKLLIKGIKISKVWDNNDKKWGEYIYDVKIEGPENIITSGKSRIYIVASSKYVKELWMQLTKAGAKESEIYSYKDITI